MKFFDAATVWSLGFTGAADAITQALVDGFDPSGDPPREAADTSNGSILMMPSEVGDVAGIKVLTLAPDNPQRGLPKIQGHYLLFDAATMTLKAMLDGEALTSLRTPALSIAAARPFLRRFADDAVGGAGPTVAILGAGPQGVGHARALEEDLGGLGPVTFIVRNPDGADADAHAVGTVVGADSDEARQALADAHIVVCATGASEALFEVGDVRDDVLVIALGSHLPEAREVPAELMGRATVVVEDEGAALREAGDVIRAIADGALKESDLTSMTSLLSGDTGSIADGWAERGPAVVKTVGMGWQDLAVARAIALRSDEA